MELFGHHRGGAIAESGIRTDLLHEGREIIGSVDLTDSPIEGSQSIVNRSRTFYGKQSVDGTLGTGEPVALYLFEGGGIRV